MSTIPERIVVDWLYANDACSDQVDLFRATFGASAPLSRANLRRAAAAGLDIAWLAETLLDPAAWRAYADSVVPVLRRARAAALAAALADALGLPAVPDDDESAGGADAPDAGGPRRPGRSGPPRADGARREYSCVVRMNLGGRTLPPLDSEVIPSFSGLVWQVLGTLARGRFEADPADPGPSYYAVVDAIDVQTRVVSASGPDDWETLETLGPGVLATILPRHLLSEPGPDPLADYLSGKVYDDEAAGAAGGAAHPDGGTDPCPTP